MLPAIRIFFCFITSVTLPAIGVGQISFDSSAGGSLLLGDTASACDSSLDGALKFNRITKRLEYCNSTSWIVIPKTLGDLNDTDVGSPVLNQGLIYDGTNWAPGCSSLPNDFAFTDVSNATGSTVYTSGIKLIDGFSCANVDVTISDVGTGGNPEYRVCSDATCTTETITWTSSVNTISSGVYVQVRTTASDDDLFLRRAYISVGIAGRSFDVRTQDSGGGSSFKYFFVTSEAYFPAVGGVTGADTLCQNHANSANLPGTYLVWLASSASDDPESRFTRASVPYKNTRDETMAEDWDDLVDGFLQININSVRYDQFGVQHAGYHFTWSNVATDGTYVGTNDCNGWTSSNGNSYSGNTGRDFNDSQWTDNSSQTCDNTARFYCVQQ